MNAPPGFVLPPGAIALRQIKSPRVRRTADLELHRTDLEFALKCLECIGAPKPEEFLREVLWRSAVVHYFKCFGGGVRFQLQAAQVYKGSPKEALEAFDFFKSLRNKHYVHDENAYLQCAVAAVIGDGKTYRKIAGVAPLAARVNLCTDEHVATLARLARIALDWVIAESEKCKMEVMRYLEQLPPDELEAILDTGVEARMPGPEEAKARRS